MPTRHYVNTAAPTALRALVSATATVLPVSSLSGYPTSYPYTVTIEADKAGLGEACEVTAAVVNADGTADLTVARGIDGTTARQHPASSRVAHDHTARDWAEPQARLDSLEATRSSSTSRLDALEPRVTTVDNRSAASAALLDREHVHRVMRPGEYAGIMRHWGPVTGSTAWQTLVTAPAAPRRSVVKTLTVNNLGASWRAFTLGINAYHMAEGIPIAPYTTLTIDLNVALHSGDLFQVSSDHGDVRFSASASVDLDPAVVSAERFFLRAQNTSAAGETNFGFQTLMPGDGRNRVLRTLWLCNMGNVDTRVSVTLNDAAIIGHLLLAPRSFVTHDVNLSIAGTGFIKVANEGQVSDLRTAGFGHLATV